jgi:hypothetical protein
LIISNRVRAHNRVLALIVALNAGLLPAAVGAAPLVLRCEFRQEGEVRIGDFTPVRDPYRVKPIDINRTFRFKAVIMENEQGLEYIKLYTYYREQHQVVLLHEASYMPPFEPDMSFFAALTGVNYLYSPLAEQEMQYGCALLEAPSQQPDSIAPAPDP